VSTLSPPIPSAREDARPPVPRITLALASAREDARPPIPRMWVVPWAWRASVLASRSHAMAILLFKPLQSTAVSTKLWPLQLFNRPCISPRYIYTNPSRRTGDSPGGGVLDIPRFSRCPAKKLWVNIPVHPPHNRNRNRNPDRNRRGPMQADRGCVRPAKTCLLPPKTEAIRSMPANPVHSPFSRQRVLTGSTG